MVLALALIGVMVLALAFAQYGISKLEAASTGVVSTPKIHRNPRRVPRRTRRRGFVYSNARLVIAPYTSNKGTSDDLLS